MRLTHDQEYFITQLRQLAQRIRAVVLPSLRSDVATLATQVDQRGGDAIYQLDIPAEATLLDFCRTWGQTRPFRLVAEGIEDEVIFPADADPDHLDFTLIVDPIDGTRGLMYGKRSAWTLLGIAPPPRPGWWPTLNAIHIAVMSELPTARAALADTLWAVRGQGVAGETRNLITGAATPFVPRPSAAPTLAGGFASLVKYFPGFKVAAARIEEEIFRTVLGSLDNETPQVFDDQYISSGGQLYELASGHDRFIADLRPILPGGSTRLCAHPYDLCAALVAEEAGVIVTTPTGDPLDAPLDTLSPVAFVGYANADLRDAIAPILRQALRAAGL